MEEMDIGTAQLLVVVVMVAMVGTALVEQLVSTFVLMEIYLLLEQ